MPRPRVGALLACGAFAIVASACGSTVQTSGSNAGLRTGTASGLAGTTQGGSALGGSTGSSGSGSVGTGTSGLSGGSGGQIAGAGGGTSLSGTTVGSGRTGTVTTKTSGGGTTVSGGTAPIPVGVLLTSTASVKAAGFSSGETYAEKDVDQAIFDGINRQGGFSGHKLQPVYASTDPNSSNWATDFAAACAKFTQDNHVQAVLGYQFNWDQGFENCLTKAGIPQLETGFNIPDAQEVNLHPLHRALAVPTIDHRSIAKLQGAIDDGVLTKKSKLGVVLDDCPGTLNSWNQVAKPLLARNGIDVAYTYQGSCNTGNNSGSANQINGAPQALLKMRQNNVDVVTFLTVSEGPALLLVAIDADSQHWHPTYVTSSLANLSALEGQAPNDQMANVKSYGWMPGQDVGPNIQPRRSSGQKQCLALLKHARIYPKKFGDFTNAYRICDAVFAYGAALNLSHGVSAGTTVIQALDSLGTSFSNPDVLDGATRFGRGRENITPAHVRAVVWNNGCECFRYHGRTRQLS